MYPGSAQKHTPSRRPGRGRCMTMGRTFFDVPCRGVSHTPHKRPARGGCRMMGRGIFFQAYRYIFDERAFVSSGDAWRAYSIRPYPTGRRCILFIPKTFTTHPDFSLLDLPFLMSPVGAYRIRPPNGPIGAGAGRWEGPFSMSPVGAYRIRPTNDPAGAILSIYG